MNRLLLIATVGCLVVILGVSYSLLSRLQEEAAVAGGQSLSRRPAAKSACPQAVVTQPPAGMEVSERELVPFSSSQLGTNTVITDGADGAEPASSRSRTIEVVSGGYVDELTESYDNLQPVETISVTGERVSLLAGSLLNSTVNVVIWRQAGVAPPCDVHAVLATNLSKQQFKAVVESVRVDHELASTSGSVSSADRNSE